MPTFFYFPSPESKVPRWRGWKPTGLGALRPHRISTHFSISSLSLCLSPSPSLKRTMKPPRLFGKPCVSVGGGTSHILEMFAVGVVSGY